MFSLVKLKSYVTVLSGSSDIMVIVGVRSITTVVVGLVVTVVSSSGATVVNSVDALVTWHSAS